MERAKMEGVQYFGRPLATAVCLRMACSVLTAASMLLLTRRLGSAHRDALLGVSLVRLPLLQGLVAFPAREVASRTAVRSFFRRGSSAGRVEVLRRGNSEDSASSSSSESAGADLVMEDRGEGDGRSSGLQSSFNLAYLGVLASCAAAFCFVPVWLSLVYVGSDETGRGICNSDEYFIAVCCSAAAGLLEALAEPLAVKAQFTGRLQLRTFADAVACCVRSLLSTLILFSSTGPQEDLEASTTRNPLSGVFHPVAARAFASAVGDFAALCIFLWGLIGDSENSQVTHLWPPIRRLSNSSKTHYDFPSSGSCQSLLRGRRWATTKAKKVILQFVDAAHLDLLCVNLKLMAQKLAVQQGETVLMLALLGESAAGVYGLVSNSASLVCRVVFAPSEASAFSAFCALQGEGKGEGRYCVEEDAKSTDTKEDDEALTSSEPSVETVASPAVQKGTSEERSSTASVSSVRKDPPIGGTLRMRQGGGGRWMNLQQSGHSPLTIFGSLSSSAKPALPLSVRGVTTASSSLRRDSLSCKAAPLLQLSLLFQGVVGLAAAAGGCLFPRTLLFLCFGASTVSPDSVFVPTLQLFSCYVFLLALIGPLEAYLTASASSLTLHALSRLNSLVSALHLLVVLPILTNTALAQTLGGPPVGAALAQLLMGFVRLAVRLHLVSVDAQEKAAGVAGHCRSGVEGEGEGLKRMRERLRRSYLHFAKGASLAFPEEALFLMRRYLGVCFGAATSLWLLKSSVSAEGEKCFFKESRIAQGSPPSETGEPAVKEYALQFVCFSGSAVPLWLSELALGVFCAVAGGAFVWLPLLRSARRIMGVHQQSN